MYHNLQQAQQLISTIDQMASQLKQQETSNRQMLSQMEQREAQAAQRLHQMQQMCQECSRVLQSHQSYYRTTQTQGSYQPEMGTPMGFSSMGYQTSGVNLGQPQNIGGFIQTQAPLIDPTTMGASTYYDSLQQFGGSGNQNLYTPGGVVGMQSSSTSMGSFGQGGVFGTQGLSSLAGQGTSSGVNMEISSLPTQTPFASTATMGPDKYQSAAQKLGGANMSMSTIGQQAGISNR